MHKKIEFNFSSSCATRGRLTVAETLVTPSWWQYVFLQCLWALRIFSLGARYKVAAKSESIKTGDTPLSTEPLLTSTREYLMQGAARCGVYTDNSNEKEKAWKHKRWNWRLKTCERASSRRGDVRESSHEININKKNFICRFLVFWPRGSATGALIIYTRNVLETKSGKSLTSPSPRQRRTTRQRHPLRGITLVEIHFQARKNNEICRSDIFRRDDVTGAAGSWASAAFLIKVW